MTADLSLTLYEVLETDDGIVRIDPSDMRALGVVTGDIVAIEGARRTYACVHPAYMEDRNQKLARVSSLTARNTGFLTGHVVRLISERLKPPAAELVILEAEDELDRLHVLAREKQLGHFWRDRVVQVDDLVRVPTLDRHAMAVKIVGTQPAGVVHIGPSTQFTIATRKNDSDLPKIGGLRDVYKTCRLLAEGHFKRRLDRAAQTLLLQGPAGCGKSLLAARLAKDLGVTLRVFDAHSLLDQWVAQGSTELALSLSELARRGPTILLLDHLSALTSGEGDSSALAVAARCVTAQLCSLLDEVPTQPNIFAIGIASGPLDPRLDSARRFDLNLLVDAPNRWGRHEILLLETANLSLTSDADLASLAEMASGATGLDLKKMVTSARLLAESPKVSGRDLFAAFRLLSPSATAAVRCEIPTTSWEEVAGLDDIKNMLKDTLSWSLQQYDKFEAAGVRPPRSVLLSGGQGTGKTSLVRSLASYMPVNFIEVDCPVLATRPQTEAADFLRETFALARRKAPCLVFFDEIDVLFDPGSDDTETAPRRHPTAAQLIAELDGLSAMPGVVVIAATNRPDRLTAEILRPGRFDYALTLPLPDTIARKKVLQIHARKLPLASDIDFERLAATTQGMSSAEIANLCNRVGMMALRNSLTGPEAGVLPPVVNADLFEQALRGRKS